MGKILYLQGSPMPKPVLFILSIMLTFPICSMQQPQDLAELNRALVLAVENNNFLATRDLLARGAEATARQMIIPIGETDEDRYNGVAIPGFSALDMAYHHNNWVMCELLLQHGARIEDDMIRQTANPNNPNAQIMHRMLIGHANARANGRNPVPVQNNANNNNNMNNDNNAQNPAGPAAQKSTHQEAPQANPPQESLWSSPIVRGLVGVGAIAIISAVLYKLYSWMHTKKPTRTNKKTDHAPAQKLKKAIDF